MGIGKKIRGFTLIELMISLGIIGLLSAMVIPSYQKYIIKSNRVSIAQMELMDAAQRLQRCYTANGSFVASATNICTVYTDLMKSTGITSRDSKGYYKIDFSVAPTVAAPGVYTLRATALVAPQTKDTGCTVLTLSSTGVKWPGSSTKCWETN